MTRSFFETFSEERPDLPPPRSTGLVFAVVSLIVAVVFRNIWPIAVAGLISAMAFAFLALRMPQKLTALNAAWFAFALILQKLVNPVIMAVMFAVVFVPFGLLMQLFYDPLIRRRQPDSYWRKPAEIADPDAMRRQF
jgi:predicted membrane protein